MLELIGRIRERLTHSAYVNEAAISHGIVTPILNALGWDSADPDQLVPEYPVERGRVDFALLGLGRQAAVFIEVKGVGRALDGDRQLFEYAFHHGVPLCVLTDGREWNFYVPGGQGSYKDRRVYRLQLDERDPEECQLYLQRYLARERVRDGSAFEDAQRDYRHAAGRREALLTLPRAWTELVSAPEDLLIELMADKAEALCGYKPASSDILAMLRRLRRPDLPPSVGAIPTPIMRNQHEMPPTAGAITGAEDDIITFTLLGEQRVVESAAQALVEILRTLAGRDASRIPALADAIRTPTRCKIARTVAEINPSNPKQARAVEFAPGWLIGLTLSNKSKMRIIRAAVEVYGLRMPEDLDLVLPNA